MPDITISKESPQPQTRKAMYGESSTKNWGGSMKITYNQETDTITVVLKGASVEVMRPIVASLSQFWGPPPPG